MDFKEAVKNAVEKFKSIDNYKNKVIRIVGNIDTDGITATSILIKAFIRESIKFLASVERQVNNELLTSLSNDPSDIIFFLDFGSGSISDIEKKLWNKRVFILDHHYPEKFESEANVVHLNPHINGIDGSKEIGAAGIAYFFSKQLNENNDDLSYLALIGAIGDVQENNGFTGLNILILDDAIKSNKVEVNNGLKIFGIQSKPIYKVLEYSTNPYMPGITGSEEGALKFLQEVGIKAKEGNRYRKFSDLNTDEVKILIAAIAIRKLNTTEWNENLFGPIYRLIDEDEDSPTKELREFSTLLNSCGRLGKASLGMGVCLGDRSMKERAINVLHDYRNEIINSIEWFYRNRGKNSIIEKKNYVIVNAEDNVRDTIIGTLMSLISRSGIYSNGTILIGMARTLGTETKISVRVNGDSNQDTRNILRDVVSKTGGIYGGHKLASGATIEQDKEQEFIKLAEEILGNLIVNA
ncbi:MAG: DHH family phosphoesterase [Nanoarchaeota archaeon]